jgi:biopolymer transport protein ExbB
MRQMFADFGGKAWAGWIGQAPVSGAGVGTPGASGGGLWELFTQSFDVFTILLLAGSVVGVAVILQCLREVRPARIVPADNAARLMDLAHRGQLDELQTETSRHATMTHRIVRAALPHAEGSRWAMRDAGELAASEESAAWFRKIDLLNIIGNLGPLVGLAGTVWGMILAFTSLREAGDQARAADLSQGISKALFHTLLGLCLAIPCLLAYGILRNKLDRLCTRAIVLASNVVEALPSHDEEDDEPSPDDLHGQQAPNQQHGGVGGVGVGGVGGGSGGGRRGKRGKRRR